MAHVCKNEHKRDHGTTRLAISSRRDHSRCLVTPNDSSHRASALRRTPRSTETTTSVACFLIANARLILSATHSKISALKISNRERMAFSDHHSPARFTPAPTRHSSLITHHFISNRNIRFTEFQLTPLTTVLTQFLTATNTCFCRTPRPPRRPLMLPVPHHSPACTDFHFTV